VATVIIFVEARYGRGFSWAVHEGSKAPELRVKQRP
jgi:hypothetical protein